MTTMAQNSELMLFVTHVETEGPLLKIWGQIDRNAATCVERMILPLSEKFAQDLAAPNPSYNLPTNLICCARFQNDGYYRAKICNIQPNGNVLVHFIDYGNYEVLPPSAIRLLENIPSVVPLQALPPLALDFILANVMPANGGWEMETIESIKQTLRYADIKGEFHSNFGSYRLLKLCYNNEDFGDLLVSKNLAVHASIQDMFASRRQVLQHRPAQFTREPVPPSQANNYAPRAQPAHPGLNPRHEDWRNRQAPPPPPPHVPEALVFKSRVLDVGSVHDVYVSYVEDGPMKFAVQVRSTSEILKQLMNDINKYPTSPLQEPPLPGSVCLGRYSLEKVLCRAVVMSVMEQKCKLYYVDFGHTEVLPYSDIFQLPPQYINPRVLSIRFTLSGLKNMVITQATKDYFKEIVSGKTLLLQVRPPEGPPLIQYGDLYDNGTNIRDIIKEKCDVAPPVFFQEPPRLPRGFKDLVHVSFVESCNKFFVQLDSGIKSLNSVMTCLDEYAKNAPQLDESFLKVGWPCCACYGEDKQWYRAQILSVKGDQVAVLYVDYGNEELVAATTLRKIHNDLVSNLRAQAIRCVLNGFQNSPFNQELANQFELIVLEKKLAMEVIDVQPNNSLVELLDCDVVPMVSITSKLQFPASNTRPVNNLASNGHSQGEQGLNSSRSPDPKYQSSKNGKPNTWGQESPRSTDWSARNRKPQSDQNSHDGKDQFQEKGRTKIVKDVENEQRQRDSNRHEGEDRLHQKETHNNNYFNRSDASRNRFERSEDTVSRRSRGNRFGSSGGSSRDDNRSFDKSINKDDSWSDRDSDTSSRGSGKRGSKRPRGIKGRDDRPGHRGGDRKTTSGKWSDGDSDRSSQKSSQSSGLRSRDRNLSNPASKNAKTQPNKSGSWNSMSPTSPVKEPPRVQKLRIPPPNITVGAVKNAEVIYTDSPTDFYVQLCPDNVELDKVMEKIAKVYNNGGTALRRSDMQQGNCCIAQYSCDSKWYRAIIKSNNSDSANVHFIDYGNSETVSHDKIKEIQADFAKLSAQAVHCKLFAASKSTWSDEEIDRFSQSAEGISLEAEFLSQENGVYEVLIKPAAPGNGEYVNKQFCGGVDLTQAKQDLKNKDSKGNPKKKREVVVPQYISPGQKWGDEVFAAGYQVDVVVTWFVNPNNFYCQILSKQSEFRTMMNNIQESYVEQQAIKNKLQVGDPVIAFFSDDGALYRAEIKEMNKLRGHIVQYVDFGNCAMVDPCKIYPVEKRFALLSKQAMHCSLRNVSPGQGVDWSNANKHEIDKYFDADKYKCTFHGTKDGKYSISLSNNGRDIGEVMSAAGLAVNPETQKKTVVSQVSTSAGELPATKEAEKLDLTLWNGQIIRTRVHNVQGAAKFYIQLPASTESGDINNLKSSTTANEAAARDHLIECFLPNVNSTPQVDDALKKSVEGKDVIVSVKSVNNNRFGVQLYNESGKRLKIVGSETEDSVSPICPLPVSTLTAKVWVTHVENGDNIWLQRSSDTDNIADLLSCLYEYYSASSSLIVSEVGKLCVAESSDKNWYRGVIEKVEDNSEVVVRFVDYGNTEKISSDAVKVLEQQFYSPHQMAIKVSLIVTLRGSEEEQKTILHDNLDDKELTATFYNVGNNWLVELAENNGKKMSEKLSELNAVAEFKDTKAQQQQEIPEMIVGNRYEVFLSHSDSPAQFWLQRQEEVEAIEVMQASLQLAAPNFSPTTGIPEEGTLCAALYSADSLWYRAEVLDADEDITTVRFIDYGNTDVIDSNSSSIKELPPSLKSIKKYGLKSRLDLIPTGSEDWSTASCEMFENMATATESPITALIIADSVPRRVELFVNGEESIGDALVRDGHAIMVHNAEDLIDEIIDLELDPRSAFVSHVNSPNEFWVQEEKSVSDLEIMTDRFIVAEMFPKLEEIKEGSLCVAKFPDDDQWYRARVNSHSSEGTQVLYIDYGNSAVSTEIRTIPEDLALIPPLSRKCCLQLPAGIKEWSEKACDKFVDLAADGATIFLLDVENEGETSVVSLTLEGVNVAKELAQLCEVLPVIDERLPPLGEENSPNIVVSHVYSPSEFWTQAESNMGELEIMAGRLIDAQSLLPLTAFDEGTICAAKFPEDEEWYRAKILSHGESGTNVLYFDYGNSAVTTELRILPEDVANIPSLATKCALAMPDDVEAWSEEANNKFNELVADGVTMFQFEILDETDPTLITLYLDGTDVVDILKPLCNQKVSTTEEIKKENIENEPTMIIEKEETVADESVKVKKEIVEDHQEIEIQKETMESTEKVQFKSEENLCEVETEIIQTDTGTDEVVEEVKEGETDKPKTPVVEEVQINGCETELAPTDIVNDIPEDEIVQETNSSQVPSEKTLATDNEELGPEKETTEMKSAPLETAEKTEMPLQIPNVDPVADSPEVITLDESVAENLIDVESVAVEAEREPEVPNELTVDDIVGNMVKVTLVDGGDQKEEIPELKTGNEAISKGVEKPEAKSDEAVTNSAPNTPQKKSIMDKILPGSISRGSIEEDIPPSVLGRRRSSCTEDKIVPGSINKGNDLSEADCEVAMLSPEDNNASVSTESRVEHEETPAPLIPGKTQRENKIVPGSISRGESPTVEISQPTTPKTSHSEKLLAGVVNLQEKLSDFEEQDEILIVEVENNIPDKKA